MLTSVTQKYSDLIKNKEQQLSELRLLKTGHELIRIYELAEESFGSLISIDSATGMVLQV